MLVKNLVSVIMPVYNTPEKYLRQSIASILQQSYKNMELIIIDDASDQKTKEVIKSYDSSPLIRVLHNERNMGVAYSLNIGLKEAKGEFIARMDSDDIAFSTRIQRQVVEIKNNPDMILVCSSATEINEQGIENGRLIGQLGKWNRSILQCELLFNNISIVHPTVLFRNDIIKRHGIRYRDDMNNVEDYELWTECIKFGEIGWIKEPLLMYRIHAGQITQTRTEQQAIDANRVRRKQLESFSVGFTEKEMGLFLNIWKYPQDIDTRCLNDMFLKLIKGCPKEYTSTSLIKVCSMYWLTICVWKAKKSTILSLLKYKMLYYSLKPNVLIFVLARKLIQKRRFQRYYDEYRKTRISVT